MAGSARLIAGILALGGVSAALVVGFASEARPVVAPSEFVDRSLERAPRPGDTAHASPEPGPLRPDAAAPLDYSFRVPSGLPSALTCDEARSIVAQLRRTLAYEPPPLDAVDVATATADWLDPNGLWTAANDSPVAAVIDREAARLVRDLESDGDECAGARAVGEVMAEWTTELGSLFDAALAAPAGHDTVAQAADDAVFEDESRPARALASTLGEHARTLHEVGPAFDPYVATARSRFFPKLDGEGWSHVVLAAAVRAYVATLDPHGAWAPRDEEASVYDVDLDAHPPERIWERGARTTLGVRVESGPLEPLAVGDLVLSIAGVAVAGLPPEQLDQLVYATTDAPTAAQVVVLRPGERAPRLLEIPAPIDQEATQEPPDELPSYRVPFGEGDALVVVIHDVRSDLGDEFVSTLRKDRRENPRPVEGLVLDLRDDGGGSTEGAIALLGLFLPGATLFPMQRRDGTIEVDRAPEPPAAIRWTKPVAALVDGDTASAAEMIAGALQAYRRGVLLGQPTYGKGCAQEYLDDDAHVGVLRLTTLLYALPDGSPVQGVGLEPSVLLRAPARTSSHFDGAREREADVPNAPPTWRGPDVRDPTRVPESPPAWPDSGGKVGPCKDEEVCRALLALGASPKRPTAALTTPPAKPGSR